MKKQKIALFLSLAWLIGMVAVFSFSPSIHSAADWDSQRSELKNISTPDLVFSITDQISDVPVFKASLGFADLVDAHGSLEEIPHVGQYLAPAFFSKSRALFDVLVTFFYFFHTW